MHCATSNKHTCTRVALHARAAQAATARTESSDTRARRASFSTRAHNVARCAHASETACTRTRAHTLSPFSRSPCRLLSYQEKRGDSEQGDSERSSLQGEANSCGGSQGRRWAWARMQRAPAAPACSPPRPPRPPPPCSDMPETGQKWPAMHGEHSVSDKLE